MKLSPVGQAASLPISARQPTGLIDRLGRFLGKLAACPTGLVLLVCLACLLPPAALADESGSTEDGLLERLLGDPLDEDVEKELFGPEEKPDGPGERPSGQAEEGLPGRLDRELGPAGVSEEANPLLEIGRKMRLAEGRIRGSDSGEKTQQVQGQIVASLDELIQKARQNCKKCQGGGKPSSGVTRRQRVGQPKQPDPKQGSRGQRKSEGHVSDPNAAAGSSEGRRPDMTEMMGVLEELWKGELPPKAREQMLDLPIEEFLPKYELLIEQYFKKLSEEQSAPR